MAGPLSHIRVLDLGRIMAAPWASQILADLGADVIKVERPGTGDDTRGWGPPFVEHADGRDAGYFLCANRGKRSVTVDIATEEGQAMVRTLAETCDAVLENFKVGTLARYGLDAASLREINPRLVYVSITGFGQTGPRADQAAYDFMIQAMGGLMSVTGAADGMPQKVGVPIVDMMTGMYAAVAVLAGLAGRERTGRGDTVDLALLDVQTAFLANQAMGFLLSGRTPARAGNRHPSIQPQDVFPCGQGLIALAVGNDGQFRRLCAVLGVPEAGVDTRFATNEARVRDVEALGMMLVERLAAGEAGEWVRRLEAAQVPCAVINDIPAALSDPQVVARGMVGSLPYGDAVVPQVFSPLRFAEQTLEYRRGPPTLGQHTEEVLREVGQGSALDPLGSGDPRPH